MTDHLRPDEATERLVVLAERYIRRVEWYWRDGDTGAPVLEFLPPLSPAEQAILDDLATMARFGVTMTPAEWTVIKADAAGLKAYLGVASPTAAQTAAATKAIIRVLATIIRS